MIALLLVGYLSNAQDHNLGFEDWHPSVTSYLYDESHFIDSCSLHLMGDSVGRAGFLSETGIIPGWSSTIFGTFRVNDPYSGRYAAVIHTWYNGADAVLTLGDCENILFDTCKVELPQKLYGISGFYKYLMDVSSSANQQYKFTSLTIVTYRRDSASRQLVPLTTDTLSFALIDDYTEFYLPVSYPDPAAKPDAVSIWFTSGGAGMTTCVNDHYLYLDDLELHYEPRTTSIAQPLLSGYVRLYPNPAGEMLRLEYERQVEVYDIRLTDISGRVVRIYPASDTALDLAGLSPGLYFVAINAAEGRMVERVVVQH